jgi:lipooligosaccharide transport system ATP-binding protein
LRAFVRSEQFMHDNLEHRIIIYGQEGEQLFERIGKRFCKEDCIMRMATLEDVFLRLTGRELRE